MANATLQAIRDKVRRITFSPTAAAMSDASIDQYINTFIENDIPTTVRLFSLRTTLTFYTQPNIDVYQTNTVNPNDPLYNFQNKYNTVHPSVFVAGVQAFYTQERDIFYGNWPQTNFIQQVNLFGDGTNGPFTGIIPNVPMLENNVVISCLDISGNAMILVDYPLIDGTTGLPSTTTGALGLTGQPQTAPSPYGSINYITGAFTATFPNPTLNSTLNPINTSSIGYVAGIPTTVLYYANKFTLRPVPDKVYTVQIEANIRPTELLVAQDVPQISQWWQWIALGAAKKIFEDRMDYESVDLIMPTYEEQREKCNSTSLDTYANQRTVTIYTNNGVNNSWNWSRWPY